MTVHHLNHLNPGHPHRGPRKKETKQFDNVKKPFYSTKNSVRKFQFGACARYLRFYGNSLEIYFLWILLDSEENVFLAKETIRL